MTPIDIQPSDPAFVLAIASEMPEVDPEQGQNWAEAAFDAWAAKATGQGVQIEEIYAEGGHFGTGDWVSDGKTVAHLRIGAEWYLIQVEGGMVRPVFAR